MEKYKPMEVNKKSELVDLRPEPDAEEVLSFEDILIDKPRKYLDIYVVSRKDLTYTKKVLRYILNREKRGIDWTTDHNVRKWVIWFKKDICKSFIRVSPEYFSKYFRKHMVFYSQRGNIMNYILRPTKALQISSKLPTDTHENRVLKFYLRMYVKKNYMFVIFP
jgi:hypothetical protein